MSESEVIVRPAAEGDLEAIQRIYAWHVLHGLASFEEVPLTLAEMRSRRAAQTVDGRPYLVAESGGAVIGDSANEASIALHRRAGFLDVGVLRAVGYKHGRWVDSVILQRALGPGDGLRR